MRKETRKNLPHGCLDYVMEKMGLTSKSHCSALIHRGDIEATSHAIDFIKSIPAKREAQRAEARSRAEEVFKLAATI